MNRQEAQDDVARVISYHERTKHQPRRYAKSPAYLDWENEPNPFRLYEGASVIPLPLAEADPSGTYAHLYERLPGLSLPFTIGHVSKFLELSVGLSAWKRYGTSSWALRMNPSSGNLHPTETHLILPPLAERSPLGGVFHYTPLYHALEQRASFGEDLWSMVTEHFGRDGFFVALSSIYWREAWKYGERAFRYCNHDAGHALACLSFSGSLLGWKVSYLSTLSDSDAERVLGFDKTEWTPYDEEHFDLMCYVYRDVEVDLPRDLPPAVIDGFASLTFAGTPNPLSREHVRWDVIREASRLTAKPRLPEERWSHPDYKVMKWEAPVIEGAKVIRRRRSAQAYDGSTFIRREDFFAMLHRTVPMRGTAPFDVELGETLVHLLIFAHRIHGIEQGLYLLVRNTGDLDDLKEKCRRDFIWQRVAGAPDLLLLYLLRRGDYREDAATASCYQDIAGDGAFSAGMIARFRDALTGRPFMYRRLFWETGMVGQVLYLEAEARGVRGTGIGCFFDDVVHGLMGLTDNAYQSLYHFTVGGALDDSRITTLPPYRHLKEQRAV
ncbi:MAG TPA: nitroreductase family protein [Dissulfurispiraceae bacterium]|nr:nitroreductase family protein [Dissulfurispiraceae bacterium]